MHFFKVIFFTLIITHFMYGEMSIVGHRGACGYEPENTLSSFQRALDLNVCMIELDVYVCASGQLVITHDDDVSVTTNGSGKVADMTLAQLRSLKVQGSGQIPTLQEVIDLVNRRIPINIELKGPGTAVPVAELIKKYIQKGLKYSDFVVSSFDHAQLHTFKQILPEIKIGILFSWKNMPKNIVAVAQKYQACFIGLDIKTVTKKLVEEAHQAGFSVFVWTINDKHTADHMRLCGVDGIFSNYPDRV